MVKAGEKPTNSVRIILNIDTNGFRIQSPGGMPDSSIILLLKAVIENLEEAEE